MDQYLMEHALRYPKWTPQDAIKLLYQQTLGCGHFALDESAVKRFLTHEWEATSEDASMPLWESIGGGYARMYLAPAKAAGIAPELIARMFLLSAQPEAQADLEELEGKLTQVSAEALGFQVDEWETVLNTWRSSGRSSVHHSAAYQAAYHPAYRVISKRFMHWWPLLEQIGDKLRQHDHLTLAIDGRSGSGKSCFASCLESLFDASVVHMDDFFLPLQRKTPERLAQPGGNVDIERFTREVIPALRSGDPLAYRPYSCKTGVLGDLRILPHAPLTVVEGVYSLHPATDFAFDASIFLSVTPQVQRERIAHRNGEMMLQRFEQEWIPLEEAYFNAFQIPSKADVCFDTERGVLLQPSQL